MTKTLVCHEVSPTAQETIDSSRFMSDMSMPDMLDVFSQFVDESEDNQRAFSRFVTETEGACCPPSVEMLLDSSLTLGRVPVDDGLRLEALCEFIETSSDMMSKLEEWVRAKDKEAFPDEA